MSTLIVVGYNETFTADEVFLKLRKLQREYLLDLEDAAVAIKDAQGKVKLHQTSNLTAAGAIRGGLWGSLIGLIFLNPLLGFAVGATTGAISGALTDVGINNDFHERVGCNDDSRQFDLIRPSDEIHAGQSAGRASGNRWPDLEDLPFERG
jgi:uncharacterized membrane protein